MSLGTPVLARSNEGNAAIIEHRKNGFLFDSPQVRLWKTFTMRDETARDFPFPTF